MSIQLAISLHLSVLHLWSGFMFLGIYGQLVANSITNGEFVHIMPSLINFCAFIFTFFSYFLLKAVGRRIILLVGTTIAGVTSMLIAVGFFIKDQRIIRNIFLYIGIFLFVINFGLTLGPVIWLYVP
jgi:hypothetical protein